MSYFRRFLVLALSVSLLTSCMPDGDSSSRTDNGGQRDAQAAEPNITVNQLTKNATVHLAKPIVVMISIDGFRADYMKKYQPPTLTAWAREGVQADGLVPSFPTLTFPNHVTLVTGRRPGNHGIVGNFFYDEKRKEHYRMSDGASTDDGSWYRGEPIWTVAERAGMLSATFFWVGSEAKIGGVDPTYMAHYNGKVKNERRIQTVTEWLKLPDDRRPHFIALYFSDVDSAGHKYGPDAAETKKAILEIDKDLSILKKAIDRSQLPVQVILVSDHGMKKIDHTVDISSAQSLRGMETTGKGAVAAFYSDDQAAIDRAIDEIKQIPGPFKVYRGTELPAHWSLTDEDRRGDIVVVGDPGAYIGFMDFAPTGVGSSNKATHGWDVQGTKELDGLFIASGSMFKRGQKIRSVDNVHVYPLVLHLLGLKAQEAHDGNLNELRGILSK